ncbi:alpha/beta hydrolase [Geopsychrobacter electrodiphilus]|uniref:alpha/beta hydrolase n=1 Tax=Geopsychrobacter electrodiphilus TaxID=225196 RepID=UPI000374E5CD|nr:alpha/beta fold hydrolase [Geopsychrobacter electrodiphilus]
MLLDFTSELERAQHEGVGHRENLPFLFEPDKTNGKALLLIHGFSGTPYEMRALGEFLCARGYVTLGVRLDGHGTTPEDLSRYRWQDWLQTLERGYAILQKTGMPISLVGQSTGALLGLALSRHKPLSRLVLLSPFLSLKHPLARFSRFLKYLIPFQQRTLPPLQQLHYYERRPLAGIEQILRLRNELKPTLKRIMLPTLILAAEGDQTVARDSALTLFHLLGSPQKEFHLFGPQSPHVLSTDENPEFEAVYAMTAAFLG